MIPVWYCPWCDAINRHGEPFCTTCWKAVTLVFDFARAKKRGKR